MKDSCANFKLIVALFVAGLSCLRPFPSFGSIDPSITVSERNVDGRNFLGFDSSRSNVAMPDNDIRTGERFLGLGRYDSALHYFFGAVKSLENRSDSLLLFRAYINLGNVYYKLGDATRALHHFHTAEGLCGRNKSYESHFTILQSKIALAFCAEGDFESASVALKKGTSISRFPLNDSVSVLLGAARGRILLAKGHLRQALNALDSSLKVAQRLKDYRLIGDILIDLSKLHFEVDNYDKVHLLLIDAQNLFRKHQINDGLLEVFRQRILLATRLDDQRAKTAYQAEFIQLSEALFNEQIMGRLAELEIEFKQRENTRLIQQQIQSLELSKETIKKKSQLILLSTVCVALGIVFSVMLMRISRRKRRTINNLVYEVSLATAKLEGKVREELIGKVSEDIGLRLTLGSLKAEVARVLGICDVASRYASNEQTKECFQKVERDLKRLRSRLES